MSSLIYWILHTNRHSPSSLNESLSPTAIRVIQMSSGICLAKNGRRFGAVSSMYGMGCLSPVLNYWRVWFMTNPHWTIWPETLSLTFSICIPWNCICRLLLLRLLIGLTTINIVLLTFNCSFLISSQLGNMTNPRWAYMAIAKDVDIVVMSLIYIRNSIGPRIKHLGLQIFRRSNV